MQGQMKYSSLTFKYFKQFPIILATTLSFVCAHVLAAEDQVKDIKVASIEESATTSSKEERKSTKNEKAKKPIASGFFASTTGLKPFDEIIETATVQNGFIPVWREDQHMLIELSEDHFKKPFLLSINTTNSLGERGLYGSQMGPYWLVEFRKTLANQVHLVALNTDHVANNPQMQVVLNQSFSPSLLASAAIVSEPHLKRGSVLVDASFMIGDLPAYSSRLEAAFRLPYNFDKANSFYERSRSEDTLTTVGVQMHYTIGRLPGHTPPGAPAITLPSTPDARSIFVGFVYNFLKLPDIPMATRLMDSRLGHFTDNVVDLSDDKTADPRLYFIKRWRLEKKDPLAAMSEPKEPIVYWLDKNIPVTYRNSVKSGVLEWNKAFERIGFSNAIVVKQQRDDDDWNNMDARHASIRWAVGSDLGSAVGPSQSDPRTGEILDADIMISDAFGRRARRLMGEELREGESIHLSSLSSLSSFNGKACSYSYDKVLEMDFALDLISERDSLVSSPKSQEEIDAFVHAVIKDTVMHEVGHTLGLKHNFKASTAHSINDLTDKNFTREHGISASVMDYSGFNIAAKGEAQGGYVMEGLGAYDFWAIEYAYKDISKDKEKIELEAIASRSTEPELVYADDEETAGVDPLVNRFDLGNDPLAFYKKRFAMARELWDRVQSRLPRAGEDPALQRRLLLSGFNQLRQVSDLVGRYIGGMHTVRDLPGSGRPSFDPVDPQKQREALDFVNQSLFSAKAFHFEPQFLSSVRPNYNVSERGGPVSVPAAALSLQASVLNRLMSPNTAQRVLDLQAYTDRRKAALPITLSNIYASLQGGIWSELKDGSDIELMRRNLQREYLKRLQVTITQGGMPFPADALSLLRMQASDLRSDITKALAKNSKVGKLNKPNKTNKPNRSIKHMGDPGLSVEAVAHLQSSLSILTRALEASMISN